MIDRSLIGHAYPPRSITVERGAVAFFARATGETNPVIARLWQQIPATEGQSNPLPASINARDLLPRDASYFYYPGSLTTPPCSEGVRWLVMQQPITMSEEQIAALRKAIGFANNRPVQPLNARIIFK